MISQHIKNLHYSSKPDTCNLNLFLFWLWHCLITSISTLLILFIIFPICSTSLLFWATFTYFSILLSLFLSTLLTLSCPPCPCPLSHSQSLVLALWLCEIFEAYIFLSSLVIYILDKFSSALELDQQPGKCHQLGILTQKMLPRLQLQRLCPAPSKRLKYCPDIHCSHLSPSQWAERDVSHWKPCRVITGGPQGPHDASAIIFIQINGVWVSPYLVLNT